MSEIWLIKYQQANGGCWGTKNVKVVAETAENALAHWRIKNAQLGNNVQFQSITSQGMCEVVT